MGYVYITSDGEPYLKSDLNNEVLQKPIPQEYILEYTQSGETFKQWILDVIEFDANSGITMEIWGEGGFYNAVWNGGKTDDNRYGGNYMKSVYTGGTYNKDTDTYDWNSNYSRFYINVGWDTGPIQYKVWNYNRVCPMSIGYRTGTNPAYSIPYTSSEYDLCGARNGLYNNNTGYTFLTDIQIDNRGGKSSQGTYLVNWPFDGHTYACGGGGGSSAGPYGDGINGNASTYDYRPNNGVGGNGNIVGGGSGGNGRNAGGTGAVNPWTNFGSGTDGGYPGGAAGGSILTDSTYGYFLPEKPGAGLVKITFYGSII